MGRELIPNSLLSSERKHKNLLSSLQKGCAHAVCVLNGNNPKLKRKMSYAHTDKTKPRSGSNAHLF